MRNVWKIRSETSDGKERPITISFTEQGALHADRFLRSKGYRVDPHPQIVSINELTIVELEMCLKELTSIIQGWDDMKLSVENPDVTALRELGRDLFEEHDERLRRLHEMGIR